MGNHRFNNMFSPLVKFVFIAALALTPLASALAYVGPGAGLSLLSALWGLLAAIGAALMFVILWPIRRMRRRKREQTRENTVAGEQQHRDSSAQGDADQHPPHS